MLIALKTQLKMISAQSLILLIEYARSREATLAIVESTEPGITYQWQREWGMTEWLGETLSTCATLTLHEEKAVLCFDAYFGKEEHDSSYPHPLPHPPALLFSQERSVTNLKEALFLEDAFYKKVTEWVNKKANKRLS
ncbi:MULTISPECIES: hypothetical protein [Nostocales]|uniref:Uncharacterized protein n=3 Tax=Nostocales TaxID=1161 RepID=A0A0C1QST5_9CYAN|nr:hypothetical protein [Tolypothrix bouteillei]KAF3883795.1 hypothetical protein DA73_0400039445 [Tolypothrix bouteillei VB521301]